MRLVSLLLLLLSTASATAQLAVTPELPLSTPAYPAAPRSRFHPALATNGTDYLAVWEDERTSGTPSNTDVFATRITKDGRVLDPDGIALTPTYLDDSQPDVIWNGASYVTVFATPSHDLGITAVEVRSDGTTGNARALVRPAAASSPKIAWNGSVYLLVWLEWSEPAGSEVHAQLFDRALEPASQRLVLGGAADSVSVASNGSGFLVAFHDTLRNRVRAARVSSSGSAEGALIDIAESAFTMTSVVWDGIQYAVAWKGVGLAQVTPGGDVVRRVSLGRPAEAVMLSWNGTRYEAVWSEIVAQGAGPGVVRASFDSSLFLLEEKRADVPANRFSFGLAIAASGTRTLIALVEAGFPNQSANIYGRFTDRPAEPLLISTGLAQQAPLAAAASPDELFGVVWQENGHTLRFGRMNAAGASLDGSGVELSPPAETGDVVRGARLAATREQFVAVYQRVTGAYVRRIGSDGSLRDREPMLLAARGEQPVVATDGRDFVLAWSEREPVSSMVATRTVLYAATLSSAGVLGSKQRISPADAGDSSVDAAAIVRSGDGYVVAMLRRDVRSCSRPGRCSFDYAIDLQRLSAAAEPSGQPVRVVGLGFVSSVTMAATPAEILVAWGRPAIAATTSSVAAQRFSHALAPIGANLFPVAGSDYVSASADDHGFQLVSYVPILLRDNYLGRKAVVMAIDEERVTERASFVYAERLGANPVIAAGRGGRVMVAYSRIVPRTPAAHLEGVSRGFVRFVTALRRRASVR